MLTDAPVWRSLDEVKRRMREQQVSTIDQMTKLLTSNSAKDSTLEESSALGNLYNEMVTMGTK